MLSKFFVPRSISRQIFVLVALSAILFHISMSITFFVTHPTGSQENRLAPPPIIDRISALNLVSSDRQALLVARFNTNHPLLAGKVVSGPAEGGTPVTSSRTDASLCLPPPPPPPPLGNVVSSLNRNYSTVAMPGAPWLKPPRPLEPLHEPPHLGNLASATLLFIGLSVTLFLAWAVRNITAPLSAFAQAADRFTLDYTPGFLPESGPTEVGTASRAFNRMQTRIKSMMDDRTRMLAAIGHDLRTPVTRLRLRAEYISDPKLQMSIISDLDHMNNLIQMALSFLRDAQADGPARPLDLASMLQTICDDFVDLGKAVAYRGPDHLSILGEPDNLKRAVTNLIDNAVAHGQTVVVSLRTDDDRNIAIEVVDDGPGIADHDKLHVFEPFWRGLDSAMKREGFGLGLSIVRAIVEKHSGSLSLSNGRQGGLACLITLPMSCVISQ